MFQTLFGQIIRRAECVASCFCRRAFREALVPVDWDVNKQRDTRRRDAWTRRRKVRERKSTKQFCKIIVALSVAAFVSSLATVITGLHCVPVNGRMHNELRYEP